MVAMMPVFHGSKFGNCIRVFTPCPIQPSTLNPTMTKKRRRQKLKAALRAEGETRAGANATINAPYEENKPSVNAESEHNGTNGFTQAAHDDDQPHQGEPQQFDVAAQAIEDGTPQLQGKASDEDEVMLPPECRHYTAHDRFDGDMPFAVRKYV